MKDLTEKFSEWPTLKSGAVVKWSACLPSNPMFWFYFPLTRPVFSVKLVFEKKENYQKEAGIGPML